MAEHNDIDGIDPENVRRVIRWLALKRMAETFPDDWDRKELTFRDVTRLWLLKEAREV